MAGGNLPSSPALFTSDFPNKEVWSAEHLPEILFYLERPENPQLGSKPETIVREDNVVLRKFEVLPDYISVDVEGESNSTSVCSGLTLAGWLVHTWRCLDSRIMLQDITDRMVEDDNYFGHRLKKPPSNALSNHSYRGCRKILGSYNDYSRRDQPHRATIESLEKLSYEKLWMNTVLSRSVEFPDRLVRVKFVRKGVDASGQYTAKPVEVTVDNYLQMTFPLDYFCLRDFDPCVVSQLEYDLLPAMSILFDLQKKAELHELGHWRDLPKGCLPESWFDRTREGAPEKPNYDGGCYICTWRPGIDAPSPKAQSFNFDYLRQRSAEMSGDFDLEKAFRTTGKSKRPCAASIEPDVQRNVTPAPAYATVLQQPGSAPAALRSKRIKPRSSKQLNRVPTTLTEDSFVAEMPPGVPLRKGTRYKIKYLEKDDKYSGPWETDTEVEPDSDADTLVDHNAGAMILSQGLHTGFGLPSSPPKTPSGLGNEHSLGEGVIDLTGDHDTMQATGYFPVDFLDSYHAQHHLAGAPGYGLASMANTPPEDQFSSFGYTSTPDPFDPRLLEPWQIDDFGMQRRKADFGQTKLRQHSMEALLQHSAALHTVMGFQPTQHMMSNSPYQYSCDHSVIPDPQTQTIDPSLTGKPQGLQDFVTNKDSVQNHGPVTPAKAQTSNFGTLIFTDEVNRFCDFGSQLKASALQESPLKNFGHGTASSVNPRPVSNLRPGTESANRRIFTINEDEHPEV